MGSRGGDPTVRPQTPHAVLARTRLQGHAPAMDPLLHLAETRRFFTRAEARDAAYDDKAVAAAVRARAWHRIQRGYFTFQHL